MSQFIDIAANCSDMDASDDDNESVGGFIVPDHDSSSEEESVILPSRSRLRRINSRKTRMRSASKKRAESPSPPLVRPQLVRQNAVVVQNVPAVKPKEKRG